MTRTLEFLLMSPLVTKHPAIVPILEMIIYTTYHPIEIPGIIIIGIFTPLIGMYILDYPYKMMHYVLAIIATKALLYGIIISLGLAL